MEPIIQEYTTLSQWGNSKATRIPSSILKALDIDLNQKFSISIKDQSIVLTPENQQPSTIHELFATWEDDGIRQGELDWGPAQGGEVEW